MRIRSAFFLLFLSVSCYGQIIDLGSACKPNKINRKGFERLKKIIGNARFVVIGEQVHGVGTDYINFELMVKFLHEEMGFNVIAQEYCFHHFGRVNSRIGQGTNAYDYNKGMYWPQALAKENSPLFDYINDERKTTTPLYMEGFDPRIFQRKAFYTFCDSLLSNSYKINLKTNTRINYLKTLDQVLKLEYNDTLTTSSEKATFLKNTNTITNKLLQIDKKSRLAQTFKNIRAFAKNAWNEKKLDVTNFDRFHEREKMMANNIFWLADVKYPNEKIILRMHNGHAAKNIHKLRGAIPDSLIKKSPNVGSRLYKRYGDSCKFIASTYYAGTYCGWDYKPQKIPQPKKNSLEFELHDKGYQYAFVTLRDKKPFYLYFNEFNDWTRDRTIKAPFASLFDGIIFINQVKMPTKKE